MVTTTMFRVNGQPIKQERFMSFQTAQEQLWAGDFGNEYISRNDRDIQRTTSLNAFSRMLESTNDINSVLEFGPNIGVNMESLKSLIPEASLHAVEINPNAAEILRKKEICHVYNESFIDFQSPDTYDLTFTSGVLIHINPRYLKSCYERLYEHSRKYILIKEYYNPTPVEVPYRDKKESLFKRDFAGEILDMYKDLKLVDYGFFYRRDTKYSGCDDPTWFLLEK